MITKQKALNGYARCCLDLERWRAGKKPMTYRTMLSEVRVLLSQRNMFLGYMRWHQAQEMAANAEDFIWLLKELPPIDAIHSVQEYADRWGLIADHRGYYKGIWEPAGKTKDPGFKSEGQKWAYIKSQERFTEREIQVLMAGK